MDEARRFLRHVIPGLVFLLYVLGLLVVVDPAVAPVISEQTDAGAWLGLLVLLAAGAIGYSLGIIHHLMFSHVSGYGIDFSDVVNSQEPWRLSVRDSLGRRLSPPFSLVDSWVVVNSIWQRHFNNAKPVSVERRAELLSDLVHGNGTVFVATILAPPTVLLLLWLLSGYVYGSEFNSDRWTVGSLIIVGAPFPTLTAYKRLREHCQGFMLSIFLDMVRGNPTPSTVFLASKES